MPTTITKTVKSAGGDYSSLAAWEAAQQGDLVAADEIREAACYDFTDAGVTIDGSTTDSTRYMRVYCPTGQGHDGKFDSSKYNLACSGVGVTLTDDYIRFERIQVYGNGSGDFATNATGLLAESCIFKGSRCQLVGGTMTTRNSVCHGSPGAGFYVTGGTHTLQNCTSINNAFGFYNGATMVCRNCYSGGNSSGEYTNSPTLTTCASSDTSGTAGLTNIACSTSSGAYLTNVTLGSEDLHIGTSSALKDVGDDLSGTFTKDIDQQTRPTGANTWDIGADEIPIPPPSTFLSDEGGLVSQISRWW